VRKKVKGRFLRRFLIALACLLGLVGLAKVIAPGIRSWQVERAIAHFEQSPSQKRADALVRLLQSHAATTTQGSRVLTLLRRPLVTTRAAYPAGQDVGIALEQPFGLNFRDTLWRQEKIGMVDGQDSRKTSGNGKDDPRTLYLRGLLADQARPGVHRLTVRGTYSLGLQRRGQLFGLERLLRGLFYEVGLPLDGSWQPARQYECEFEMPVEVTVVPPEEAEPIELMSSDQLDKAMTGAIHIQPCNRFSPYRTDTGQVKYERLTAIFYKNLPIAAAFRLQLRLTESPDGSALREHARQIRARAGASGRIVLDPRDLSIKAPGAYAGTVVLTPDPNIARIDPAITAIWGGTLELPVSFTVHPEQIAD